MIPLFLCETNALSLTQEFLIKNENDYNCKDANQRIANEMDQLKKCVEYLEGTSLDLEKKQILIGQISELFQALQNKQRENLEILIEWVEKNPLGLRKVESYAKEFRKKVFKKTPISLQYQIHTLVKLIAGWPKEHSNFGEVHLKENPAILTTSFPLLSGHSQLSFLLQLRKDLKLNFELTLLKKQVLLGCQVSEQKLNEQLIKRGAFFKKQLSNLQFSHRQMKHLFNILHPCVQELLKKEGIQPPFYGRGFNPYLYKTLGAHFNGYENKTTFRIYAPNAARVVLNLTKPQGTQESFPLSKGEKGIWYGETYQAPPKTAYHLMITGPYGGDPVKKVDPFAFENRIHDENERRINHESVIFDVDKEFQWQDQEWMQKRKEFNFAKQPFAIYEIHVASWKLDQENKAMNWRDLAKELGNYCKEMGYNAVELMGLFVHPQPISMGYQITNFFALTDEMGNWEDFNYFVNYMHTLDLGSNRRGISVIIDWVPAHFANDSFGLSLFDGTPLLEDDDPNFASHPTWGTKVFDYTKQFTKDYLTSNITYLIEKGHCDGIRYDAIASMLYSNYDRPEGFKRTNRKNTELNLEAIAYLRNLNAFIHQNYPDVWKIAEESSGFPNVTRLSGQKGEIVKTGGLGFDLAWHMWFMNATIDYCKLPVSDKQKFFDWLTNTLLAVDVNHPRGKVVLPYSHDENANGKGTIFTKMAGKTIDEKYNLARLLLAYQLLRAGGPILDFMGNETLQKDEWHGVVIENSQKRNIPPKPSFQWEGLSDFNIGARECRKDLLHLYHKSPGLWDQTDEGFSLIRADDSENCVVAFHRRGDCQQFACLFNTSDDDLKEYLLPLPTQELEKLTRVKVVYNTDEIRYGGKGRVNGNVEIVKDSNGCPTHFKLRLPPCTAILIEEEFV